jgi:hypothetical protein
MSILPWDDWIYHLPFKREEVNSLHKEAVALQGQIEAYVTTFNHDLDSYKSLIAGNAALVIIANTATMDDLQYSNFTVEVAAIENPPVGFVPVSVASVLTEIVGTGQILKALYRLGSLAKSLVSPSVAKSAGEAAGEQAVKSLAKVGADAGIEAGAETATEITTETVGEGVTEAAAETAIEGASLAGLSSTGVGIFLLVGVDAAFGAINGAQENSVIESQIASLNTAIAKCRTYLKTLTSKHDEVTKGIQEEEGRFIKLVSALSQIDGKPPSFDYNFPILISNTSQFAGAMSRALSQYGPYVSVRDAWERARLRDPQLTRDKFVQSYLAFAPQGATEEQLKGYCDVLARYSKVIDAAAGQVPPAMPAAAAGAG